MLVESRTTSAKSIWPNGRGDAAGVTCPSATASVMATQPLYPSAWIIGRAGRHGIMTMVDREGQDWGEPGEMASGGVSPVIGDIERTTGESSATGGGRIAGTVMQALRGLTYPLRRDDVVRQAAEQGAPGGLMDLIIRLPDRVYVSAEDVARELQGFR